MFPFLTSNFAMFTSCLLLKYYSWPKKKWRHVNCGCLAFFRYPKILTRVWFWVLNCNCKLNYLYRVILFQVNYILPFPPGIHHRSLHLWPVVTLNLYFVSPISSEVVLAAMSLGIARRCVEEMNRHEGVESLGNDTSCVAGFKQSHSIHVWYIYLHLPQKLPKCRYIYHTWILWETMDNLQATIGWSHIGLPTVKLPENHFIDAAFPENLRCRTKTRTVLWCWSFCSWTVFVLAPQGTGWIRAQSS